MADSDGPTRLPGRDEIIGRLDSHLEGENSVGVLAVEVAGYESLREIDEEGAAVVVREVQSRLDRLVRGRDDLGFVPPARFLLGCPSLTVETAGALVDRIRGGVALPVDVAGDAVSLVLDVGMAFSPDPRSTSGVTAPGAVRRRRRDPDRGTNLLEAAEADLVRTRHGS